MSDSAFATILFLCLLVVAVWNEACNDIPEPLRQEREFRR